MDNNDRNNKEGTERLSPNVHGMLLSQFFTTLFGYREKVYIFPCLNAEKHKELTRQIEESHEIMYKVLHGREVIYIDKARSFARKVVDPFVRTAGSDDALLITKLNDFVDLGYDIFFSINPLTFSTRSKRTVARAQHILLESDTDDLEFQEKVFNEYQDSISSMVYSGNKSIHALVKVDTPLFNPYCLSWKHKESVRQSINRTRPSNYHAQDWYAYDCVANYWIKEMAAKGLTLDKGAAMDWSRISRVPGFKHSKTGQVAKIIFLNPDAAPPDSDWIIREKYWHDEIAPVILEETGSGRVISSIQPFSLSDEDEDEDGNKRDGLDNLDTLNDTDVMDIPDDHNYSDVPVPPDELMYPLVNLYNNSIPLALGTGSTHIELRKSKSLPVSERDTGVTNVTNFYPKTTFLEDLETYETLKLNGIPCRHTRRRTYHGAMITAKKVFQWSEDRFRDEWRKILSIHPCNTEGSIETNVYDLVKDCGKRGGRSIYLPVTASLPSPKRAHRLHFLNTLSRMGCEKPDIAFRIIDRVAWHFIRTLPIQCQEGRIGLHSLAISRACNSRAYRGTLDWLHDNKIVVCKNRSYLSGKDTRQYFINIPLILYLLGFRSEELNWNKGSGAGKRGSIWKAA